MDRREIPGFYFDEEKQKYFRIQADHQAPPGAKYSRGNVQRKKRKLEQEKVEHRHEKIRRRETVARSSILNDRLFGIAGVQREIGASGLPLLHTRDEAVTARMEVARFGVMADFVSDAFYSPHTTNIAIVVPAEVDVQCNVLYSGSDMNVIVLKKSGDLLYGGPAVVCSSTDVLWAAIEWQRGKLMVLCVGINEETSVPQKSALFANKHPAPVAMALREANGYLAVRCTDSIIWLRDLKLIGQFEIGSELHGEDDGRHFCPTIEWLDDNTIAFGDNSHPGKCTITLLDVRNSGSVRRFELRDRITGLQNADESGHRLLVSTNRHIYLFDTQMGHGPLLKMPHVHAGPELHFATNKRGLVAAVDRDNAVHVYSTRLGRRVMSLPTPQGFISLHVVGHDAIRKLRWYDSSTQGSFLIACQGLLVLTWNWGGRGCPGNSVLDSPCKY